MTDAPTPTDDIATLRMAIDQLTARLDRIEARSQGPSVAATVQTRVSDAWSALRGQPQPALADGPPTASASLATTRRSSLPWAILTVCAALLGLLLAVELAEEVFEGLWHIGRWLD